MAMRLVGGAPLALIRQGPVTAGVAIQAGDVLAITGNVLIRATATSTIHTVVGVAAETITTAAALISYIPFVDGQEWDCDTASNTSTNQLFEGAILSTTALIDNTSSEVAGPTAIFLPHAVVGTAAERRLLGTFIHLKSTST